MYRGRTHYKFVACFYIEDLIYTVAIIFDGLLLIILIRQSATYTDPTAPVAYLKEHPEITDVLFTGADPLVLKASMLKKYIEPILDIESIQVIRISSKSLAW